MDAIWIALAAAVFLVFHFRDRIQRYFGLEEERVNIVVGIVSVVVLATWTAFTLDLLPAVGTAWCLILLARDIARSRR